MDSIIMGRVNKFCDWIHNTWNEVDALSIEDLEHLIAECKDFKQDNCIWLRYDAVQYILERAVDRVDELKKEK